MDPRTREYIRQLAAHEAELLEYVAIDAPRYRGTRKCGVYGYRSRPRFSEDGGSWEGDGMTEITFVELENSTQVDFSQLCWTYEEFFA